MRQRGRWRLLLEKYEIAGEAEFGCADFPIRILDWAVAHCAGAYYKLFLLR